MNIANNNYMKIVYVVMVSAIVLSQGLDSYRSTTVSNLEYHQREDGYSAHTPSGNSGGIYPNGTGPVIFLDGVLIGGFQNEQLKVTGSIYTNGLVNGTIQNGQLNQNSSTRIFKIRKNFSNLTDEQLNQEVMQSTEKCNCVVERQNKGIIAIEEYSSWPDSSILVDGTTDSHLAPSLSQTGNIWDNRAGDVNLPSYARDYDRFDLWDMDDVVIDFGDSSLSWEYYSGWLHTDSIDGSATFGEPVYQPFAAYRIKYSTGDTLRLFAGFWDTNGDGHWSVNSEVDEAGETVFDWVCPTYGSEAWEPIYLIQGYDTDGNEVSYDPAQEATYIQMQLNPTSEQEGFDALNLAANSTWGDAAGDFNYPFMTAALLGAYYGPNEAGSYVEGSPEGATSSLPQAGHYDKFGNVLTVDHYYKFSTSKDTTITLDSSGLVTDYDRTLIKNRYMEDWLNWPAHLGAPFYDIDNDGIYEPLEGETPGYADADEVIWYVATDADAAVTSSLYGSEPIGIELQFTVFSYDHPETLLKESVFKRVRIINKSTNLTSENGDDLTDAYISLWSDPDVGDYTNDLVGVDTSLSMMFAYNGDSVDGDFAALDLAPPSVGYTFIHGPKVQGSSTDTAIFDFKKVPYYKNLPASSFGYFIAGGAYSDPGPYGDSEAAREYYNLMRGFAPIDDLDNPTAWVDSYGNPTKFPFAGDPVSGTGDLDTNPSDRRMLINSGPFTLAVGDTQDVLFSVTGGLGDNYLSSISQLNENAFAAKEFSASLVETLTNPTPDTTVQYITWYPGDTDHNGVVDEYDIISIGMYFHNTITALDSSGGSFAWSARNSIQGFDINDILMADVNGDGIVDERDVVGIGLNWGNTYSSSNMMFLWDDLDIYGLSDEKKVKFESLYHSLNGESEPMIKVRALLRTILGIGLPTEYSLKQNYPNPFNASTMITFSLPKPSKVSLSIYNVIGQKVDTPINNINYLPGNYNIRYDAKSLGSGVYFVRINTPEWSSMKKIMLIK